MILSKSLRSAFLMVGLSVAALGSAAAQDAGGGPLAGLGSSKDPVRIDAKELQVVDKEQKAIYSGDVVVTQGAATLRCSTLTVFYTQRQTNGAANAAPATPGSSVRKVECEGPLSAVSGNSTVTGDRGVFNGATQIIEVIGNVILTDCKNVQRGDKLVYNMKTTTAVVSGGRVSGIFEAGSADGSTGECQ
jgi:lipopolysaccharide export system protein LptA